MTFLSPLFKPLHCEAEKESSSSKAVISQSEQDSADQFQYGNQYSIPHLPGEGRFVVSAKVCSF